MQSRWNNKNNVVVVWSLLLNYFYSETLALGSVSSKGCRERERRSAVEQRARQMLRPRASQCAACADADLVIGGLCDANQEELEKLCEDIGQRF